MWRRATIANAEALATTQVWEYRLPTSGILNGVLFHIEATNGADHNINNQVYQCIDYIQLIDGSRVIFDMSGVQSQMVSLVATRDAPRSQWYEDGNGIQTLDAFIPLGLKKYDNEVGLDLSTLKNPVLRVSIDLTTVRAAAATAYLANSANISAVLFINDGDDQPSPTGYLKTHELDNWTTAAAGVNTTQGPVDGPWARLFIRAHLVNNQPDAILTDCALRFDSGQFVVLDEDTTWQSHNLPLMLGKVPRFDNYIRTNQARVLDLLMGTIEEIHQHGVAWQIVPTAYPFVTGQLTQILANIQTGAVDGGTHNIWTSWWCLHPWNCMYYDFADMGFVEAQKYQRAEILLTQGVAAAAAHVWIQQIMPNAAA